MTEEKKNQWYMGWGYRASAQDAVKHALQKFVEKYGKPPSEILIAPQETLEPMEGFNFVVHVDPYVNIHTMLIGVLDDEEANIRLVGEAE